MQTAELSIGRLRPEELSKQEELLVITGEHFLSFAIFDQKGQMLLFEKYAVGTGELDKVLGSIPWLQQVYAQVKLAYFTPDSLTVPASLYEPATLAEQLSLVHGEKPNQVLMYDFCSQHQVYVAYRMDKTFLKTWFLACTVFVASAPKTG
jgi:hypothetical protein